MLPCLLPQLLVSQPFRGKAISGLSTKAEHAAQVPPFSAAAQVSPCKGQGKGKSPEDVSLILVFIALVALWAFCSWMCSSPSFSMLRMAQNTARRLGPRSSRRSCQSQPQQMAANGQSGFAWRCRHRKTKLTTKLKGSSLRKGGLPLMPTRRCLGLELLDRACKLIPCLSWCDVVFSLGQQSAPRAKIHFACHLYSTASLWLALKQGTATQNTWHTMSFTHILVDSFGLPSLAEPHICSAPNSAKAKQRVDTRTVALLPSSKLRDSPSLERPNSS